ncbi:hypothetical protein [Nitrosomonas sp.]|uniref:hypothetical protein n=1 Tax=Nitrosomonas sp. TaxID=42353 RepID=UPI0025CE3028|nr:hypothetical protein [Nitrosomonas sp.]MBY0484354.1 hypothetical protein [Nitrosomonas sp.]
MSSDNNSDAEKKHWSYVEHMWITYKNNDSSERKDFYSDIKGAKYPDDAFRIPGYQYQIAPEPEEFLFNI